MWICAERKAVVRCLQDCLAFMSRAVARCASDLQDCPKCGRVSVMRTSLVVLRLVAFLHRHRSLHDNRAAFAVEIREWEF